MRVLVLLALIGLAVVITAQDTTSDYNNRKLPISCKNRSGAPTIAFTARVLRKDVVTVANQRVVYEDVVTNVGGGYDAATGIFTAPATGVYVFNTVNLVQSGNQQYLQLWWNGEDVTTNLADGTGGGWTHGSSTITLPLEKGDEVWVQTPVWQKGSAKYRGVGLTMFSGWMLP